MGAAPRYRWSNHTFTVPIGCREMPGHNQWGGWLEELYSDPGVKSIEFCVIAKYEIPRLIYVIWVIGYVSSLGLNSFFFFFKKENLFK